LTTAGLVIGIVIFGFPLGELVAAKEIDVGMDVAVLRDITILHGARYRGRQCQQLVRGRRSLVSAPDRWIRRATGRRARDW